MRSKCRTLDSRVSDVSEIPEWNYDGSSCYQATTERSEYFLKPVTLFPDPFREGDNVLVFCEAYKWKDMTCQELIPTNTNYRGHALEIFDAAKAEEPWYGIEQEYSIMTKYNKFEMQHYGWPYAGYPAEQGPYYCSVGGNVNFGRELQDAHYKACLYSGIKIAGTNAEVMPG